MSDQAEAPVCLWEGDVDGPDFAVCQALRARIRAICSCEACRRRRERELTDEQKMEPTP